MVFDYGQYLKKIEEGQRQTQALMQQVNNNPIMTGKLNPGLGEQARGLYRQGVAMIDDAMKPFAAAMPMARLAGQALPAIGNVAAGFMDFGNRQEQGEDVIRAGSGAIASTLGGIGGGVAASRVASQLASKAPGWLKIPAMGAAMIGGSLIGSAAAGGASNLVNDLRPDQGFTEARRFQDAKNREQQALQRGDQIGAMQAGQEANQIMQRARQNAGVRNPLTLNDSNVNSIIGAGNDALTNSMLNPDSAMNKRLRDLAREQTYESANLSNAQADQAARRQVAAYSGKVSIDSTASALDRYLANYGNMQNNLANLASARFF